MEGRPDGTGITFVATRGESSLDYYAGKLAAHLPATVAVDISEASVDRWGVPLASAAGVRALRARCRAWHCGFAGSRGRSTSCSHGRSRRRPRRRGAPRGASRRRDRARPPVQLGARRTRDARRLRLAFVRAAADEAQQPSGPEGKLRGRPPPPVSAALRTFGVGRGLNPTPDEHGPARGTSMTISGRGARGVRDEFAIRRSRDRLARGVSQGSDG